ncbi:MAG: L-rhamnose mutarotase, partial [Deltaproteobacteria bacterium]
MLRLRPVIAPIGTDFAHDVTKLTQPLAAGVLDFTIYLDKETDTLFATQTLAPNHTAASLRENPIMRKWWAHMAPLMETNPD